MPNPLYPLEQFAHRLGRELDENWGIVLFRVVLPAGRGRLTSDIFCTADGEQLVPGALTQASYLAFGAEAAVDRIEGLSAIRDAWVSAEGEPAIRTFLGISADRGGEWQEPFGTASCLMSDEVSINDREAVRSWLESDGVSDELPLEAASAIAWFQKHRRQQERISLQTPDPQPIALSLPAELTDPKGSNVWLFTVEGIPEGAQLNSDSGEISATEGRATVRPDQLDDLKMKPPALLDGDVTLSVTAHGTSVKTKEPISLVHEITFKIGPLDAREADDAERKTIGSEYGPLQEVPEDEGASGETDVATVTINEAQVDDDSEQEITDCSADSAAEGVTRQQEARSADVSAEEISGEEGSDVPEPIGKERWANAKPKTKAKYRRWYRIARRLRAQGNTDGAIDLAAAIAHRAGDGEPGYVRRRLNELFPDWSKP